MFKKIFDSLGSKVFPSNRLYERLSNLVKYFIIFNVQDDKITILEEKDYENKDYFCLFDFNSDQGMVRVTLSKHNIGFDLYNLEYTNYAGVQLFEIESNPEDNIITPNLGVDLMAQDIDLAIFELECYLFEKHGDINIAYAKWNQEQKELKQLHHQELQKLL